MSTKLPKHPLPIVVRAQGGTATERYLQRLCDQSFLSLWSYANVYRNQKTGQKGDGKELCDLLVVFGDDVLIFSDKSCAFPQTGDVRLDWSRWFRKAVGESAIQAWGAERWLRGYPDRVFLDKACTQPLPLDLPLPDRMRVHLLVVAHNVADRCASHFGGGSSSTLTFNSALNGNDHYHDPQSCVPFEVGWLDENRRFVHVLDDTFLDILLKTRDTITDFVDYLRWKEDFLCSAKTSGCVIKYCGEEDILANYLLKTECGRHGFSVPMGYDAYFIPEGDWADFEASPQRAAQIGADRISYLWDEVIEKFNKNILGGTSYEIPDTTTYRIADREKIMRFFARESRLRRRFLAQRLLGLAEKTEATQKGRHVVISPSNAGDPYYCFLVTPRLLEWSSEKYRVIRAKLLEALCRVTKVVYPDALDIVGLATEPGIDAHPRSEDALYLNARVWNEEMEAEARKMQQDYKLLTNFTTHRDKAVEFPVPRRENMVATGPNPRNKPCPCGSGKKYKKCCRR